MAVLAQRLKSSREERDRIASMWFDVIRYRRRSSDASKEAEGTEWFGSQLMASMLSPTLDLVPRAIMSREWICFCFWHRV
jgi:hypothetical protein